MSGTRTRTGPDPAVRGRLSRSGAPAPSRRWAALVFVALAQMMIALDATIVTIALPSAQVALRFTDADRQWVVTAYTLAFGGLLLLGGRVADHAGRRRAFLISLAGFAGASALGGVAGTLGMLVAARALQGASAALMAPAVLALLTTMFVEPRERARAFAVFGGIAGAGGAVGLLLGGVLTAYLGWRWCLYVNVPVAVATALGGRLTIPDTRTDHRPRLDLAGAVLATGALVALVAGCAQTANHGWDSAPVLAPLLSAAALLALFVLRESRASSPLLPPRILADRNRAGAYLSVAFAVAGMLGLFLFLTYYLQVVLGYSALRAGLAFLPLSAAVLASSQAVSRALPRVPPRALIVPGLLVAAAAMVMVSRLTMASGYLTGVLPAEIVLGLGIGCVFVPAMSTATQRVPPRDAGVAAAVVNTAQQVGGSIGVAVLNTVAATATAGYLAAHPSAGAAHLGGLLHGYTVAAGYAAGLLTVAAMLAAALINAPAPQPRAG
ncbi:MFS transporter [Gandjariella thermophila]|uniref:MFS transporter n=1 Tax=Gandjariella thermophila TaxID=1931992 RepID=A0A4D4J2K5_9PSEU|nr:MFS transporter [Gandjariella thermophila]GDY28839.1 MFS transporter [Gandjariella thermophila]